MPQKSRRSYRFLLFVAVGRTDYIIAALAHIHGDILMCVINKPEVVGVIVRNKNSVITRKIEQSPNIGQLVFAVKFKPCVKQYFCFLQWKSL